MGGQIVRDVGGVITAGHKHYHSGSDSYVVGENLLCKIRIEPHARLGSLVPHLEIFRQLALFFVSGCLTHRGGFRLSSCCFSLGAIQFQLGLVALAFLL